MVQSVDGVPQKFYRNSDREGAVLASKHKELTLYIDIIPDKKSQNKE